MARQMWMLGLLLLLGLLTIASASPLTITSLIDGEVQQATGVQARSPRNGLDEIIFFEDWETGNLHGWRPVDLTATPSPWHIDDWNVFPGNPPTCWWVGDTTINGYLDDWYMVLMSPTITLPAGTPMLSFWHRYKVEQPGGEPAGYNGWDGMNLRISTNNGQTWTVVPSAVLTPPYDRSSLYSFGFQHGEGLNIPGWCGNFGVNWHHQTANLTQWAGQSVMLRFAFASDPAYSTPNDPTLFGWQIDRLRVYAGSDTAFSDDCNQVGGWTHMSNRPTGGNLWRVATDATAPNGPNIVVCNNAQGQRYNPDMNNVLESPYIDLRSYQTGTCIADVQCTGVVMCEQADFPDCDYWGMEVSADSGMTWCAISNPTCSTGVPNYVYIDLPANWASFNESYGDDIDFSLLLGNVIKFRFTFQSNGDQNLAVGPKFDGFQVDYSAGFPNDVTCYTLQARFPNVVNRPFKIKAYFRNVGQNQQNDIQAFWRVLGQAARPFLGRFSLAPGASITRDTMVTIASSNLYTMLAYTTLSNDENLANDTSRAENIQVEPTGSDPEIGYDNRTIQYRFNFARGNGAMVHFTPVSDSVLRATTFDLDYIKAHFDMGQPSDLPIRLHVYLDNQGDVGQEIVNLMVTVRTDETGPDVWKEIDLTGDTDTRNMTTNFWVWFEVVSGDPNDRYPQVLGDDEQLWADRHFYTYQVGSDPATTQYFFAIHALLHEPPTAVEDVVAGVPREWALEQNFPNPFNPVTEIGFAVPRAEPMTLKVYNMMGQEVVTLVNGVVQPGYHKATFDGTGLASGVYMYRLESSDFSASHKMLLLK